MGTTRGETVEYCCSNDCQQSGCPGHTVRVDLSRTSDVYSVDFDENKPSHRHETYDEEAFHAMLKSFESLR